MGNRNSTQIDRLYLAHLTRNPRAQAILQSIHQNNSNPPVQIGDAFIGEVDIENDQFPQYLAKVKRTEPIKNNFMIDKGSLKLHQTDDPTVYYLTFKFSATKEVEFCIYTKALDYLDEDYNTQHIISETEKYPNVHSLCLDAGENQEFPANTFILDTKLFTEDDLSKVQEENYPMIITMEPRKKDFKGALDRLQTYCVFKLKNNKYNVEVIRQKLQRNEKSYILNDIYEITSEMSSKDCTICLTRAIDVVVLPCRHMFLCGKCSKDMRSKYQNKCSICRKGIQTYLKIQKAPKKSVEDI